MFKSLRLVYDKRVVLENFTTVPYGSKDVIRIDGKTKEYNFMLNDDLCNQIRAAPTVQDAQQIANRPNAFRQDNISSVSRWSTPNSRTTKA